MNDEIPDRAGTLAVLRVLCEHEPVLMLSGDGEGYGTRWTVNGQQIQPVIARFLMHAGYIAESGVTEFGARKLVLTPEGLEFRKQGLLWWDNLGVFQRMKITIFG
jgi:hypothetical protein